MTLETSLRNMKGEKILTAASFWDTVANASALQDRIANRTVFLKKTSSLRPEERRILLLLLTAEGVLTRGDIALQPGSAIGLDGLVDKLFAYLRMDRALLTNRMDRIYLYPEVHRNLESLPLVDRSRFVHHIWEVTGSKDLATLSTGGGKTGARTASLNTERREALLSLVRLGGFVDFGDSRVDDFLPLVEPEVAEPLLVHDSDTLVPVLAVSGEGGSSPSDDFEIHFSQSLYLSHLLKISDCLAYRRLDRRHFTKTFTACVKGTAPAAHRDRYQGDLEALGVIDMDGDNPTVDRWFASLTFRERLGRIDALLSPGERKVLERVGGRHFTTRLCLVASLAAEKKLGSLFEMDRVTDRTIPTPGREIENSIDTLLFRGYMIADQSGAFLKKNDLYDRTAGKNSVILNNDLEIVAFPELISYYALNLLACYADLVDFRETVRLRVTKKSVLRGISLYGGAERFLETVKACSRVPVGQTVIDTIEEWASSYVSVGMERRIVIITPGREAGMKLLHNVYIRKHLDKESDGMLVFGEDTDINRLTREIRKENVFIDPRTPESPSFGDPPGSER